MKRNGRKPNHCSGNYTPRIAALVVFVGALLLFSGLSLVAQAQLKPLKQSRPNRLKAIQTQRQAGSKVTHQGPKPVVEVMEKTTFDFGSFWAGGAAKHSFKIKNKGDAVLEIRSIRPG